MKDNEALSLLIIEDNFGDFVLISDYIEEQFEHAHITHATRFEEAKILLSNLSNKYDAVLLDLTLPDKQGEALITEITQIRSAIPVIILTGYGDLAFSIRSLTLNISDYLLKDDITAPSLYKSIKYNIERKRNNLLLQESEKRYINLFQLSPQPMWIVSLDGYQFLQVNNATIEQYGYSEAEFLAMRLFDLVVDDMEFEERNQMAVSISESKNIYKGRFRHIKKNNEVIDVDIYSSLIEINNNQYESTIAIDVTEKIRLEHRITKAIIKTQEDERYEIGTELHDNVCQILASSQMSLEMIKDTQTGNDTKWIDKSKALIGLALEEIRNISHRLAPSFYDSFSLVDTFQELIENFNVENKYECIIEVDVPSMKTSINTDLQLNLYRILQEQLRNISKYAQAQKVTITLFEEKQNLRLNIIDNGIGFDPNQIKKGIGLANIKRRAELFSGTMEIDSHFGLGCKISVIIPLNN
jgi:PAS domain S-box-containing protein